MKWFQKKMTHVSPSLGVISIFGSSPFSSIPRFCKEPGPSRLTNENELYFLLKLIFVSNLLYV